MIIIVDVSLSIDLLILNLVILCVCVRSISNCSPIKKERPTADRFVKLNIHFAIWCSNFCIMETSLHLPPFVCVCVWNF